MRPDKFRQHTYVPPAFFDYLDLIVEALEGGITPAIKAPGATIGNSVAAINAAITKDKEFAYPVTVEVRDVTGEILKGFDEAKLSVSISTTSVGGDAAIDLAEGDTGLVFRKGVAQLTVVYTGAWLAAETVTLKVGHDGSNADKVLGFTLTPAQVKDTLVA